MKHLLTPSDYQNVPAAVELQLNLYLTTELVPKNVYSLKRITLNRINMVNDGENLEKL